MGISIDKMALSTCFKVVPSWEFTRTVARTVSPAPSCSCSESLPEKNAPVALGRCLVGCSVWCCSVVLCSQRLPSPIFCPVPRRKLNFSKATPRLSDVLSGTSLGHCRKNHNTKIYLLPGYSLFIIHRQLLVSLAFLKGASSPPPW